MIPLLPFYAALLIALSIFFGPNINWEGLPAPESVKKTISGLKEHVSRQMAGDGIHLGTSANQVKNNLDVAAFVNHVKGGLAEIKLVDDIIYKLNEHSKIVVSGYCIPEWGQPAVKKLNELYLSTLDIFAIANKEIHIIADKIYLNLECIFEWVTSFEQVKNLTNEYSKLHNLYITPLVEHAVDLYNQYLESYVSKAGEFTQQKFLQLYESDGDDPLGMFLVISIMLIILTISKAPLMWLLKSIFGDISFVINNSSMYGPDAVNASLLVDRADEYVMMKDSEDLVRDEIEELEQELKEKEAEIKIAQAETTGENSDSASAPSTRAGTPSTTNRKRNKKKKSSKKN